MSNQFKPGDTVYAAFLPMGVVAVQSATVKGASKSQVHLNRPTGLAFGSRVTFAISDVRLASSPEEAVKRLLEHYQREHMAMQCAMAQTEDAMVKLSAELAKTKKLAKARA